MVSEHVQSGAGEQPLKPRTHPRRVSSERAVMRRERVIAKLIDPTVVAEDVEGSADQANKVYQAFNPRNGWQDWLTSEIAVTMVRLTHCSRQERRLRDYASYRAFDFWEDDQKVEVETLALRLHRQPGKTVVKLRQTPLGCDWLLARWRFLAKRAVCEWTDEQRTLAGSLVGDDPVVDPTAPGFAAEQVAELETLRERVEQADEVARGLVEADMTDDIPNLAKLRRYQRSLQRQLGWYIDQFHVEHPERWDDPARKPDFIARELTEEQRARIKTWSGAEPTRSTVVTSPAPDAGVEVEVNHEKPKTKPLGATEDGEKPKTKPFWAAGRFAAVMTGPGVATEPIQLEDSTADHQVVDRPKRVNHVRDANQRRKQAKRRASLAALGG